MATQHLSKRRVVLWNNHASRASEATKLYELIAGDPESELIETESADHAERQAAAASNAGAAMVVAAGGDGTVHRIAQGLMAADTAAPLGVIPLGTGNDLCRSLGIPLDPLPAWELLTTAAMQAVDLVRVTAGGTARFMINCGNGGNSSRILECIDDQRKADWGEWAYFRSALEVLGDMQTFEIKLGFDQQPAQSYPAWNVVLGNGQTAGGGIEVAPRASLSDGLLDVVVILDGSPLDLAAMAAELVVGDYLDHERVVYRQAKSVRLEVSPAIDLIVDGEVVSGDQFSFQVLPGAIEVASGTR